MTIAEVAKLTGKSEQSVRRAIKSGKLQSTMVGGRYKINEDDITDSLRDSQPAVTDSRDDSQSGSQMVVIESKLLKARILELENDKEGLQHQLTEKDKQIESLQTQLQDTSQRHDTVVMQIAKMLEYERQPFWRRWLRHKALPAPGNVMEMEPGTEEEATLGKDSHIS